MAQRISECKVCTREAADLESHPVIPSINTEFERPIEVHSRDGTGVTK